MLLTLLKATNAIKLKDVVPYLSMSPLDIDLLLYDAQEAGEVPSKSQLFSTMTRRWLKSC